jgi:hypothetical protein
MKYSFSSGPIDDTFDLRANRLPRRPLGQEKRVECESVNAETNNKGHNNTQNQMAIELGRLEFLLVLHLRCRQFLGVAIMPVDTEHAITSMPMKWEYGETKKKLNSENQEGNKS